ncbi:maltose acetyltransferase [Acuticoccus sediminis]|uniref:Nodulation protein L n=1 Tax=Acuticoccus sediminis TaxID=2184697 RepID=A0A8B2NX44_9HYPH|nr:sugar O-acetyltransferase [Acuticoccus sediminis]RAI00941.1 maltose acetyltransferase [Acuticoccus sediminis]
MSATSNKERMLAGELYLASDLELVADYEAAQTLVDALNATVASDTAALRAVLGRLLGHLGEDAVVRPSFRCDYGFNIAIGARTFVNYDCVFLDCAAITLGADVQVAPGVHLYTATHPLDAATRRSGLEAAHPIVIGDGAWLGGRVVVCPGVTIGENTVVAAGSVVTRDLPAGVLAAGSPCRVVRTL